MKPPISILLLTLCMSAGTVSAQNMREAIQNERQIYADKAMLERDTQELESFRTNAAAIQSAMQADQFQKARVLADRLVASMYREINQTKAEIEFAQIEVGQSTREQGTNRRENRRNRRQFSGSDDDVRDIVRDRHNTRDDRRDTRDDVLDLKELNTRFENQKALYKQLKAVNFGGLSLAAKEDINQKIVRTFILTMEADLKETQEELREDKRERREDRRERRDDRMERRERF